MPGNYSNLDSVNKETLCISPTPISYQYDKILAVDETTLAGRKFFEDALYKISLDARYPDTLILTSPSLFRSNCSLHRTDNTSLLVDPMYYSDPLSFIDLQRGAVTDAIVRSNNNMCYGPAVLN